MFGLDEFARDRVSHGCGFDSDVRRCGALVAAAMIRSDRHERVLPFAEQVVPLRLHSMARLAAHAEKLARIGSRAVR